MSKGTEARKRPSRREQESQEENKRIRGERQSIQLFIAGLGVVTAQLALAEVGLHGPIVFWISITLTVMLWLFALFFNKIATSFPSVQLRLRTLARPQALFTLLCGFVILAWILDYSARVSLAAISGGSFQSPQAQAQAQANEALPLIPTHARLEFPIAGHGAMAQAIGPQDNIFRWNLVNTGQDIPTLQGGHMIMDMWVVLLVFEKPTRVDAIYVRTIATLAGKPIPPYVVQWKDSRTAAIVFRGELSGITLDIGNQP